MSSYGDTDYLEESTSYRALNVRPTLHLSSSKYRGCRDVRYWGNVIQSRNKSRKPWRKSSPLKWKLPVEEEEDIEDLLRNTKMSRFRLRKTSKRRRKHAFQKKIQKISNKTVYLSWCSRRICIWRQGVCANSLLKYRLYYKYQNKGTEQIIGKGSNVYSALPQYT